MPSAITLTTDFGISDAYVAMMKGVILDINPRAAIIDISHVIEPQNIVQAAFVLHTAYRYFPNGTIHIAIIDPDVGSQRKAILLRTPSAHFLAPDNGVLSYVIDELHPLAGTFSYRMPLVPQVKKVKGSFKAVAITNPVFWRQPVSSTFHGRDIFAPVAAHLSLGVPMQEFGEIVDSLYAFPPLKPYLDSDRNLVGHILHIDHFGNLVTNIRNSDCPSEDVIVKVGEKSIQGVDKYYAETEGLAVITGSSGYMEISLRSGNAAARLGTKIGDQIKLTVP